MELLCRETFLVETGNVSSEAETYRSFRDFVCFNLIASFDPLNLGFGLNLNE